MKSKSSAVKLGLSGFFLSFLLLIPVSNNLDSTILITDPYWRYQGQLLAESINVSGHLSNNPYQGHSYLLYWVNQFTDDFASPLFVTIVSKIVGKPTSQVFNLPLFAPAMIFSTALLAKRLTRDYTVFVISILLGVSYKYLIQHITFAAHRGALGWTIVLTIVCVLVVTTKQNNRRQVAIILPLFLVLPMAVHTLPVASLLLFTSLFVFSNITDTKLIDRLVYLTGICVIIAYNTVVFDWIGKVFLKFSVAITTINYNSPSVFISSLSTSAGLYPGLKALGHSFTVNSLYSHAITYSNVLALSLVGFLFAYRLYVILSQKSITEMSQLDNLLGAFGIQGFAGVAILPLFAASGGFSPLTLGLIIAPLFGSISLYLIFKRIWSTDTTNTLRIGLIIVILIAVVAPAFVAFSYKPMSDGQISFSTTPENKAQITWTGSYTKQDQRVFSDFNSLSRYYAIIGPGKTYIPPTGSPAYSTEETAGKVIEYYYEDPASVQVEANVYLVSHQMIDQSMFHLGAITTEPNPELDEQLSRSGDWNKVYSTGKDYTFVTG